MLQMQRIITYSFHNNYVSKRYSHTVLNALSQSFELPFKPLLVSFEGNIGAGKSTLLTSLRSKHPEWIFIDEPVQYWSSLKNDQGESMLEIFYKDRRRWSYTFQNCAILSRYQIIQDTVAKVAEVNNKLNDKNKFKIFITERCMETDYYVFTKMLKEEGSIDSLEYELYQKFYNHLNKTVTPLSAIVHVNTPPETCAQRITKRGRTGEEGIPLDYLTKLDAYQTTWINNCAVPSVSITESETDKVESFINKLAI